MRQRRSFSFNSSITPAKHEQGVLHTGDKSHKEIFFADPKI
jgi:hypothetical protein